MAWGGMQLGQHGAAWNWGGMGQHGVALHGGDMPLGQHAIGKTWMGCPCGGMGRTSSGNHDFAIFVSICT